MAGEPFDLGEISIYRGDEFVLPIEDVESDEVTPVNLLVYGPPDNWKGQARAKPDDDVSFDLILDTTQLAEGKLYIKISGDVAAAMTATIYHWDVQSSGGSISPITVYKGTFRRDKDVTRP